MIAILLLPVAGCTAGPTPTGVPDEVAPVAGSAATSAAPPSEPVGQEYRFTGYVIGPTDGDEAALCGMVILQSLPPSCGEEGATVVGWDWSQVAHEAASGISFGDAEVVGTWDAATGTLTVTRPPTSFTWPPADPVDFSTPCPEPAGGWESVVVDPARADFDAAYAAVEQVDGFTVAWSGRNPGSARPTWTVLNVRTAGDVAAIERAARAHWSGPLCVVGGAARSAVELRAVRDEVQAQSPTCSR